MPDIPGSGRGPEILIDVVDFASLQSKWQQFRFENNLLADGKIADRCAPCIDELITLIGAENILRAFTTIAVGNTMGFLITSKTFIYCPGAPLSQNIIYICKALRIPPPHPYREEPAIAPMASVGPEPAPIPPVILDERDLKPGRYPDEWTTVHEGHGAKANVAMESWNAEFSLVALDEEGCFVQARLPQRLRPFPLQNACRILLEIPGMSPLLLEGTIKSIEDSSESGTALKIMFPNLIHEEKAVIDTALHLLKNPPPGWKEPQPTRPLFSRITAARGRIAATIGASVVLIAAGAGLYLTKSPKGSQMPSTIPHADALDAMPADMLIPLVPIPPPPTVSCRIRFAPPKYYFPKCDGITEPEVKFLPKAQQPRDKKILRAHIAYSNQGRHCQTRTPIEFTRNKTQEFARYAVQCN